MNKIFKSAFVALVALIGLTMTSCVNKYDYDAATASGEQVYFDNSTSKVALSKDATSFTVPVLRVATTEAATIALTSKDESGIFTIPSSVSFAAGENTMERMLGIFSSLLRVTIPFSMGCPLKKAS